MALGLLGAGQNALEGLLLRPLALARAVAQALWQAAGAICSSGSGLERVCLAFVCQALPALGCPCALQVLGNTYGSGSITQYDMPLYILFSSYTYILNKHDHFLIHYGRQGADKPFSVPCEGFSS